MLDSKNKNEIKKILHNDGIIAFATDTVWGLGCDAGSERAVKRIYEIKHRDTNKPLILMSDEIYPLLKYVKPFSKTVHRLIKTHFPGALTLVLPKSGLTPDYITSGMDTVGIRVPDNRSFAEICLCAPSRVLATTSANPSFEPPALTYDTAVYYFKNSVDCIVPDCGNPVKGIVSTVAAVCGDDIKILRQGEIII